MHIDFVEVSNFRKLLAVRIDIAKKTTVFVGANNSGKSSAMVALRYFLLEKDQFSIDDFTLSHWPELDKLGKSWEEEMKGKAAPDFDWGSVAPALDVWLFVPEKQIHFVQKILPTIDWDGSPIGVRLRLEPKKLEDFKRDYLAARTAVDKVMAATAQTTSDDAEPFSLWPKSMVEFLSRRLRANFEVKAYLLDPAKCATSIKGEATPQPLPEGSEPLDSDPFKELIQINEISAQRGLGLSSPRRKSDDGSMEETPRPPKKLSAQLRNYYAQHLDPFDHPQTDDLEALQAIHNARNVFGKQLESSFADALKELEGIGYPGLTDPRLSLAADLRPLDVLRHGSAIHYEVPSHLADAGFVHRLPEESNGLGYQNLVSMVFALMSFRDKWILVGKAGKKQAEEVAAVPPLHLVLVEEPEAHLHAQVQQVFITHAYEVLRNRPGLGESEDHRTQLIVSTHSSHVAHEAEFSSLRYFRRMPINPAKGAVPVSRVVCLSQTFGKDDKETERFVKRYLKITHCDLFFADGVILVEGPAERIIVPHMVRNREAYAHLRRCFITWLEIGGSHAHRLRGLLEDLGLNTLVITDLDAKTDKNANVPPKRGAGLLTRNHTLASWVPKERAIDSLFDLEPDKLTLIDGSGVGVRVAYQQPVKLSFGTDKDADALANTFEDALIYRNIDVFKELEGNGLAKKIRDSLASCKTVGALSQELHEHLAGGGKAEFAMTTLASEELAKVELPPYIDAGLKWLISQLQRKEKEVAGNLPLDTPPPPLTPVAAAAA
ncbi:AAA family ATPase [Luteimonas terricola]|uniref:ATP-dependent endonuclease n=1 Tax=Luteimonas terricola TaxID=645597 RepID=A0ABQ2EMM1_9GAMM|nr:AAA family ATPase [Luteimonas terricola]GGK16740.1 hypothetical protein GCM10011394_27450 [Luteimonas terricola]